MRFKLYSLCACGSPILRQQMRYFSEHPEEVNKVAAVQQQVAQVISLVYTQYMVFEI